MVAVPGRWVYMLILLLSHVIAVSLLEMMRSCMNDSQVAGTASTNRTVTPGTTPWGGWWVLPGGLRHAQVSSAASFLPFNPHTIGSAFFWDSLSCNVNTGGVFVLIIHYKIVQLEYMLMELCIYFDKCILYSFAKYVSKKVDFKNEARSNFGINLSS